MLLISIPSSDRGKVVVEALECAMQLDGLVPVKFGESDSVYAANIDDRRVRGRGASLFQERGAEVCGPVGDQVPWR